MNKTLGQRLGSVQLLYQQINNCISKTLFGKQASKYDKDKNKNYSKRRLLSSLVKVHEIEN